MTTDGQRFYAWLLAHAPADEQYPAAIAKRSGIAQSTVKRWADGSIKQPGYEQVKMAGAAVGGGGVVAALIAAGYLTEAEAGVTVVAGPPRDLTDEELADEVRARLLHPQAAKPAPGPGKVHHLRPSGPEGWRQSEHDLAALHHPDAPDADLQGLDDGEE